MAFWSGPSVPAFARLTEVVARLDEGGALELAVVDVDGSLALYQVPAFMGKVHGAGETAWVRNGKIVATSGKPCSATWKTSPARLLCEFMSRSSREPRLA